MQQTTTSGSSKNFMVCKAPQLGGNEALGTEICAGLWGIDRITYIPIASKKLFMVLSTSPLRQWGKNIHSIFEAVFCRIILLSPGTGNRKPCRLPAALSRGLAHHAVLLTAALVARWLPSSVPSGTATITTPKSAAGGRHFHPHGGVGRQLGALG
jgi:hypothetical protein